MAGVFTDNQPDFSFLLPGEVRTFSQHWYPIVGTGPVHEASLEAAVSLEVQATPRKAVRLGVAATRERNGALVRLEQHGRQLLERTVDLAPDRPFLATIDLPEGVGASDLRLSVAHQGCELVAYQPAERTLVEPPPAATEPPPPEAIASLDELYLTGRHLQQYRHATRRPEDYHREALRRDPGDSRCNTAMGEWHLRRGELALAERHLRAALARLTLRNPNPRHGEASYLLGLALRLRGDLAGADSAFGKAGWDGAFTAACDTARAELAMLRGDMGTSLAFVERALAANPAQPAALGLRASLLRRAGAVTHARSHVAAMLAADPLDVRALHEQALLGGHDGPLPGGSQTALDIAHEEARAGLLDEAVDSLRRAVVTGPERGSEPLLHYTWAWLEARRGDETAATEHLARARAATPDHVFPARLEEIEVLEWAIGRDPRDARAHYFLGNLLYDRRRYGEAIAHWRASARLERGFPTVHRNLAIAEVNVLHRPERARAAYHRALRADPSDARVLYEYDQLRKRSGDAPAARLRDLGARGDIVLRRDDLAVEYVTLLNRVGRHAEAAAVLAGRRFHPWEGGEGLVSAQWVVAHRELARVALGAERPNEAAEHVRRAMDRPANLGEGKHLLTAEHELQLLLGRCLAAAGDPAAARAWWERATLPQGDPDGPPGDGPYWQALALRELGDLAGAEGRLDALARAARRQARARVRIPYFATSLPTLLLFEDDLTARARVEARYLEGLALLGRGRARAAWSRFSDVLAARPEHLEAALRLAETEAT
jgi:tetratricopeptide (TPR) repeat protein